MYTRGMWFCVTSRRFVRKSYDKQHLEDPGVDGTITLKWIFERLDGGGIDWIDGTGGGLL